jgi:A/G-specific adenine glycosylase
VKQSEFGRGLLAWYKKNGRQALPWKIKNDPYHIWLSEIMLQQTQVTTVIPYYHKFIKRFPTIKALAKAPVDAVLHRWAGLGYYARARNLHKAARVVIREHTGRFPRELEAVRRLPGIGRSTAGAILAFGFGQRHAILDGNVKRVLARYYAVDGWAGKREVEEKLWRLAERHTPTRRVADYTQAIMDLGATLCTRTRPDCRHCPLTTGCRARKAGNPQDYPTPKPRKALPVKTVSMLLIRDRRGHVLLQRRPPTGIWGGLWSLPECRDGNIRHWCRRSFGIAIAPETPWPPLRHTFSHYRLDITPIPARLKGSSGKIMENTDTVWYNPDNPGARGLATPVKRLLEQLRGESRHESNRELRKARP